MTPPTPDTAASSTPPGAAPAGPIAPPPTPPLPPPPSPHGGSADAGPAPAPRTATGRTARLGGYADELDSPVPTVGSVLRAPFVRPLLRFPLKKAAIWAAFLGLLFALRGFFGLIFLTFVFSYITSTIVGRIEHQFSNRRTAVLLVFGVIVGLIVALGAAAVPRAIAEGTVVVNRFNKVEDPKRFLDVRVGEALGARPVLEGVAAIGGGPFGAAFALPHGRGEKTGLLGNLAVRVAEPEVGHAMAEWLKQAWKDVVLPQLKTVLQGIVAGALTILMALLFSFIIVWDTPKISAGVARLRGSRLGDVWDEVAPSIATFARLLGRAFEAQLLIALVNTTLTAVGMALLGIKGIGFLSVIVFLCSFIPIAGVFISTVPICVVALTSPDRGGLGSVIGVVLMVTVVHIIEAYVLNPRIYGHHMKLHPLAVLVVLYLCEHLFGLWGLIVGVPLATYAWRHLILGEVERLEEPAASPVAPAPKPA